MYKPAPSVKVLMLSADLNASRACVCQGMAIELQATYSKKLGLPNYSSHCYVVSLRTELTDLSQVEAESARVYRLLQESVYSQVQEVGFMPDATPYGMDGGSHEQAPPVNRLNGHGGKAASPTPVATPQPGQDAGPDAAWNCSDKQRELIQKLGRQAKLQWEDIERIAQLRFDQNVRSLDRKQASILIEALLAHREENTRAKGSRAHR